MKYLRKFETTDEFDAFLASDNYIKPNVSLIAGTSEIKYNILLGVFIQHIDGSLYTTDEWTTKGFTSDQANGVAVIAPNASFVMALKWFSGKQWSANTSTVVNGVAVASTAGDAALDLDGKSNTAAFIAEGASVSVAAPSCANYVFPNGVNGYLPSLGELKIAHAHKDEVDAALAVIGSTGLTSTYWSSTQASAEKAWTLNWGTGNISSSKKSYADKSVRPFTSL